MYQTTQEHIRKNHYVNSSNAKEAVAVGEPIPRSAAPSQVGARGRPFGVAWKQALQLRARERFEMYHDSPPSGRRRGSKTADPLDSAQRMRSNYTRKAREPGQHTKGC